MVRQLGREIIEKYSWLERANITMGYSANLLFDFADLDDLCKDIEGELDSHSLGAGFSSQGQRIDEFVEHRSALLSYTSDVLYDIDEYLENPLYKGFNNAVDLMAAIDMRDAKTDNTIGLQEHTSMYVGAGMYDEVGGDMSSLNLEDFIGSRNKNNSLTNYQKVDDFAELFAKDYEDLVNNDKIDPSKVNLQEYLDSLVLKEFAHKKDAPFWKELLESLSEMTVVIPIIEAATGKTLITGDYLTGDERAFKVVSGAVSLVTLGYGAAIAKGGGMALAKMFAADILAEAVSGSTVIVCDKAGVPSAVTVALAIVLGSTTGVIADKALLKNGIKVTGLDEVDNAIKGGVNSFSEFSDVAKTIGNRTDLTDAQKVKKLQELFESSRYKADINVPSDLQYINGFDAKGNVIYDWPDKLGFDESTITSISRNNGLPDTWDRYGYMGGSNFADVPVSGKYSYSERAIPYVENEAAYHIGTFNNESYFDKIDAIKGKDIDLFNNILKKERVDGWNIDDFEELCDSYDSFINNTSKALGNSIDVTYGVKGNANSWGDMSGGAGQIVTPFGGDILNKIGILKEN